MDAEIPRSVQDKIARLEYEIEGLRDELTRLDLDQREIEDGVAEFEDGVSVGGNSPKPPAPRAQQTRRERVAFDITWDLEEERYVLFVPDGCLVYAGSTVTVPSASEGYVTLAATSDGGATVYGHIVKSSSTYEAYFNTEATRDGAVCNFVVGVIGSDPEESDSFSMCKGMVCLGGGDGGTPDGISVEIVETQGSGGTGETRKLQIKDFGLEHEEELADTDMATLLGLPVNACASSEALEAQTFFLAKRQIPSSEGPDGLPSGKSLAYLPPKKVNIRPLLFNKVKQCDFVANGDDTNIEIYVPSLMPAPESGITIDVEEDSEGYPIIVVGYEGSGGGGGSSTTGYSSSKHSGVYVPDMSVYSFRYGEHNLQVKYCREVWEDGLLKSRAIDSSWTTITTAVEESVCKCGSSEGEQNGGSSQS